jgi:hypothetical protein
MSKKVIFSPIFKISAELNNQAKMFYNKTVQEPIDLLTNMKERTINYGANTV